jgi:hypothetical protein
MWIVGCPFCGRHGAGVLNVDVAVAGGWMIWCGGHAEKCEAVKKIFVEVPQCATWQSVTEEFNTVATSKMRELG